jgi:hypothetical protein
VVFLRERIVHANRSQGLGPYGAAVSLPVASQQKGVDKLREHERTMLDLLYELFASVGGAVPVKDARSASVRRSSSLTSTPCS